MANAQGEGAAMTTSSRHLKRDERLSERCQTRSLG